MSLDAGNFRRKTAINSVALVLEGGGMRGIYSTGVIDFFLDEHIYFDYIIGVSAGAAHALSYISRQRGRARRVSVDYCKRSDYMGLRCLLSEGSLFGMDLLFRKIPYQFDPYDFSAFEKNVASYVAVVTNMQTGLAEYFSPKNESDVLSAARASCSLPIVSPPVVINGVPYLDGGIADSIPVLKARADGYSKMLVILTQPKGFRKKTDTKQRLYRALYSKYPLLCKALETRNDRYNATLDYIDELEQKGEAFVLQPSNIEGLGRMQRDPDVLNTFYRNGYRDSIVQFERLQDFLGEA